MSHEWKTAMVEGPVTEAEKAKARLGEAVEILAEALYALEENKHRFLPTSHEGEAAERALARSRRFLAQEPPR